MSSKNRVLAKDDEDDEDDDSESWLVTYADAITLLMAFFIMLVSFSKVDLPLYEEVQSGIKEEIGGVIDSDRPIFSLHAQIQSIVFDSPDIPQDMIEVGFDDNGVVIDFSSIAFFKPGTAELMPMAEAILGKIKRELEERPYDLFLIDIEGHTDNTQTSTNLYPSNWELSAARASIVTRRLIELGLEKNRMKASGYADIHPKYPNIDIMGQIIPENQFKNQRVTLRLYPGFIQPAF